MKIIDPDPDKNDTIMVPTKYAGGYDGDLSITVNELLRLIKAGKVSISRHEHRTSTMRFLGSEDKP